MQIFNKNISHELLVDHRELLSKVSKGDELAFRKLYDHFRKLVYNYALKITKSDVAAEDILTEVFLKIWQHKNPADIEDLERYLKVATRNMSLNVLRRRQLEQGVIREMIPHWTDRDNATEETIFLNDTTAVLEQAIEQLPTQQRAVYTLCKVEGLKYEEAADRLSLSPLTVKTHMQHALRFLRSYVNRHTAIVLFLYLWIK